jgi:aminoglycoside 6-adenylyltransferase
MRTENEILECLLNFAGSTEEVRAVILNGSRVDPAVSCDFFSDYDVIYCVRDPSVFIHNLHWMNNFGERIVIQHNIIDKDHLSWHVYLMIFKDGTRLDLTFFPIDSAKMLSEDSLTKVLLDKDKVFEITESPNDFVYWIKKPAQKVYDEVINEFWFCSTNVAKGIWRKELCYASQMYSIIVHPCLVRVLEWHVGMENNWKISTGKFGKFLQNYLSENIWDQFEKTFPNSDYNEIWNSLFISCDLIRQFGPSLAQKLDFSYPFKDDSKVSNYLSAIRSLPENAISFNSDLQTSP